MHIKRKIGADEIEVAGTEAQCMKALTDFIANNQVKWTEKSEAVAKAIRRAATERNLTKAHERSVMDLLEELLGGGKEGKVVEKQTEMDYLVICLEHDEYSDSISRISSALCDLDDSVTIASNWEKDPSKSHVAISARPKSDKNWPVAAAYEDALKVAPMWKAGETLWEYVANRVVFTGKEDRFHIKKALETWEKAKEGLSQ